MEVSVFRGRNQAYDAFINAVRYADDQTLCVLLVDSEDELPAELPKSSKDNPTSDQVKRTNANHRKAHLINRDGWDLTEIPSEQVHLMVRCMETWIVSDPDELQSYYQQGFLAKSLPTRLNLEDEPKESVSEKLRKATKDTSKGAYDKIKHASKLLGLIAPKKVADRCPRFATFVSWLDEQIRRA